MSELISIIISKINYWVYIVLMMIGLYAMIAKRNLIKKVIGMNILQTAVILFFISLGANKMPPYLSLHTDTQAKVTLCGRQIISTPCRMC